MAPYRTLTRGGLALRWRTSPGSYQSRTRTRTRVLHAGGPPAVSKAVVLYVDASRSFSLISPILSVHSRDSLGSALSRTEATNILPRIYYSLPTAQLSTSNQFIRRSTFGCFFIELGASLLKAKAIALPCLDKPSACAHLLPPPPGQAPLVRYSTRRCKRIVSPPERTSLDPNQKSSKG